MKSIKCVIVGDGAVGKTSMLYSFIYDKVPDEYVPTIMDNYNAQISTPAGKVALGLWDTAGQEDYDRIRPLSYPSTDLFLVCYSILSHTSYENVKRKWIPEVQHYCPSAKIIVVGTRIDLRDNVQALYRLNEQNLVPLTRNDGEALAKSFGVKYVECSAYLKNSVKGVFDEAIITCTQEDTAKKVLRRKRLCQIM